MVILPRRNEPDLDDVPKEILEDLQIHLVADVADVLNLALTPAEAHDVNGASEPTLVAVA